MPTFKTVWTSVPRARESSTLVLSVCVTPRDVRGPKVDDDPEFRDWPATLRSIPSFSVTFTGHPPIQARPRYKILDSHLWRGIFGGLDVGGPVDLNAFARTTVRENPASLIDEGISGWYGASTAAHVIRRLLNNTGTPSTEEANLSQRALGHMRTLGLVGNRSDEAPIPRTRAFYGVSKNEGTLRRQLPTFRRELTAVSCSAEWMRRLGLVIDLDLPFDQSYLSSATPVTVSAVPQWPHGARDQLDLGLETNYILDATTFRAAPRSQSSPYRDGFLRFDDPSLFRLIQYDTDAAALAADGATVAATERSDNPSEARPPLRSLGFSVIRTAQSMQAGAPLDPKASTLRAQEIERQVKAKEQAATNPTPQVGLEDIARGVAIDVLFAGRWSALCRRQLHYEVSGSLISDTIADDEAWISLAASLNPSENTMSPHPAVFRWEGWSLGAPLPGVPAGRTDEDRGTGRLRLTYKVLPNSLPPLLIGETYRFRARVVDLAGNRVDLTSTDMRSATPVNDAAVLARIEPLPTPVIALRESLNRVERPTESLARLVIRSENPFAHNDSEPTQQEAQRHLVPPRGAMLLAQRYGKLVQRQQACSREYQYLVSHDEGLRKDMASDCAMIPHDLVTEVPYVPDAGVEHVLIELYRVSEGVEQPQGGNQSTERVVELTRRLDGVAVPFYGPDQAWPYPREVLIRCAESAHEHLRLDVSKLHERPRMVTIWLPKGERARLVVTSLPRSIKSLQTLGWAIAALPETSKKALDLSASPTIEATYRLVTGTDQLPSTSMDLVHAVKFPLVPIHFHTEARVADQPIGASVTKVLLKFDHDPATVGRIDVFGEWSDLSEADLPGAKKRKIRRHVSSLSHEQILMQLATSVAGAPAPLVVTHDVGDTRYHPTRYQLVVSSRDQDAFEAGNSTRTSVWCDAVIKSSTPLRPPLLTSVLPTFEWSGRDENDGSRVSKRTVPGCRVYLGAQWYSSGIDERLGVVILAPESAHKATDEGIRDHVSQLGVDPLWPGGTIPKLTAENFPLRLNNGFRETITVPILSGPPITFEVLVIPHAVRFEGKLRQLYCADVDVRSATGSDFSHLYAPLLRLAFARCQENAVSGARMSGTVPADMASLMPERSVVVTPVPNQKHKLRVEIHGPTHSLRLQKGSVTVGVERTSSILGQDWYVDKEARWENVKLDPIEGVIWSGTLILPNLGWLPWMGHRLVVDEVLTLSDGNGGERSAPLYSSVVRLWR